MISKFFNYFYQFFMGFSVGILLNDLAERRFPNETKIYKDNLINFFVNTSYNSIYYYSKLQIYFLKVKNNLNIFIESNPTLVKLRDDIYIYVFSKNINKTSVIQFIKNGKVYENLIEDYDFTIYSLLNKDIILRRLFYRNDDINETFLESNIKFMLIEFRIGENTYKIDLKTQAFNYYLIDNKFTKDFFIFYIKNHIHNSKNDCDTVLDLKCSLKIIDHDVNKVEIEFTDKNESIILEKTGYKIIP